MKLPGYIKLVRTDEHGFVFRVRTWHPSLWPLLARALLDEARRRNVPAWHPLLWWRFCVSVFGFVFGGAP